MASAHRDKSRQLSTTHRCSTLSSTQQSKYTPHVLRSRCGLGTWKRGLLCDIVRQGCDSHQSSSKASDRLQPRQNRLVEYCSQAFVLEEAHRALAGSREPKALDGNLHKATTPKRVGLHSFMRDKARQCETFTEEDTMRQLVRGRT